MNTHPLLLLLHLAGAVMLLIWAVRMVRTGVERAIGSRLQNAMRDARGGIVHAAAVGTLLAVILQSATAVGVLAAGLAAGGILGVPIGIAALLGADLGSALVVKILSFDLSWLIPLLLIAGATLFLKFDSRAVKQSGRILLGAAFVLLSLKMIGEATEPLRHSSVLPQIVGYLRSDAISAFVLAAGFTWLLHSSIAAVLLLVAFAGQGLLPLDVALPMLLGANLGAGVIAVWLTRGQTPVARRIPLGNLLFRLVAVLAAMVLVTSIPVPLEMLGATEGAQLVNAHLAFNLVLALISLPFVRPMDRLVAALLREPVAADEAALLQRPASALEKNLVGTPRLALPSATRECLRMGETIETMFRPIMDLFESGSGPQVERIRQLDADVNRAHTDIKLFIAEMNRGELTREEARRGIDLTDFAINMEHVGDLIAKTILPLVDEMRKKGFVFSREGWQEMTSLHARVLANLQLSLNVLVSGDLDSARQLTQEKEIMRKLERDSHERHLRRLQSGKAESIETSDIHLEVVRAFKEINSLLVTVAYPILNSSGQLLGSRLVAADDTLLKSQSIDGGSPA